MNDSLRELLLVKHLEFPDGTVFTLGDPENSGVEVDTTLTQEGMAADAKAIGDRLDEIQATLDDLQYKAISIASFTATPSSAEMGSIVTSITLKWSINKTPTTLTLDGTNIDKSLTTKVISDSIKTSKSWTLKAVDARNANSSKTASLTFYNGVYYGVSETWSADIMKSAVFTKTLTSTKARTITCNAAAGKYIWYCLPKRLGTCKFNVGGFDGGFSLYDTVSFTNPSGYTEDYYIYKSDNAGLGSSSIKIT